MDTHFAMFWTNLCATKSTTSNTSGNQAPFPQIHTIILWPHIHKESSCICMHLSSSLDVTRIHRMEKTTKVFHQTKITAKPLDCILCQKLMKLPISLDQKTWYTDMNICNFRGSSDSYHVWNEHNDMPKNHQTLRILQQKKTQTLLIQNRFWNISEY